ncbi:MAG TPA: tRNA guanosine(34) transglycosylase Tgt [Bradyrhizobium sp.]|uniref:tRNA guanosine(34) transglycosylase Tgt n=1 Tax=Bradyrhizobium sp. TaxID=376 RepID=UPI002CB7A527|nr:tRNA guanosine(34) transglycosylase Tgt [Bradyrhizobium sp.]HLZ00931.1 tRNA guanosine(34) transglycosylase Tgt [Bradyrhizobium sp.]
MTLPNHFEVLATDGQARAGRLTTPHGLVRTPAFMPVGTAGAMKGVHWREVRAAGTDIALGNTYHLMLRPGAERIAALGGLQKFSGWNGPMLTDSGGFQVMSLSDLRKIDEKAVTFRSHIDGATVELSPERSIEVQLLLGSDIAMQMDECVRLPAERADIERAMQLSLRWGERSRRAFEAAPAGHMLFGIAQGGDVGELRCVSARGIVDTGFHGYAIGGLAVGEPQAVMLAMIEEVAPLLPVGRPRYLMGVGTPEDLLEAIRRGMDMFDCVMPTRNGRHGVAFTRHGQINLRNARHADDPRPLDETSDWPSTREVSRAYLHHLVKAGETLGAMLLSEINIAYYQRLMHDVADAVARGAFSDFYEQTRAGWARGDIVPR